MELCKIEFLKLCMLGFSKLWGFEKIVGGEFLFIFFGLQGLSLSPFIFFFFLCNFVSSIVWLSLLHQLWFWFSNLFHFFFFIHWILFKGFQHTTFGLLVCFVNFIFPRVIIASVYQMPISPLYLLPYEVFFLGKLKLPRRLVLYFWISCSICSVLFIYISLSLSHTHTCFLLWCEYLVWQISWLKCPLSLIAWSHEAGAIQTSHSDWNWNMVPKPSMGLNKMNDPYLGSFWERIFLVGWW